MSEGPVDSETKAFGGANKQTFKRTPSLNSQTHSLVFALSLSLFLVHAAWLAAGQVQKLVLVITGVESKETLERWVFNVETDKAALAPGVVKHKSHKDIQGEIGAIIRQITASVTFLPLLDEACTFDLLVYADEAASVPRAWEESDPRYIAKGLSTEVRLRSFTTSIHKVAPTVSYRAASDLAL